MIEFIDRATKKKEIELVYGENALKWMLKDSLLPRLLRTIVFRLPLISWLYGLWQKMPWTRIKIKPFIEKYNVDSSEFLKSIDQFYSFNDFFIRKLKPEVRPIGPHAICIPADGRYYFYQDISQAKGIIVKGKTFDLETLIQNRKLAANYKQGSLIIGRLCPTDYHRFHFPCDCIPTKSQTIRGSLWPVNPYAVKKRLSILMENKRTLTCLETELVGTILFIEVGAACVGTIHQTYQPNTLQQKGAEKGYFSFGGSALILLFEPGRIMFDPELVEATLQGLEIRCLMGQPLST